MDKPKEPLMCVCCKCCGGAVKGTFYMSIVDIFFCIVAIIVTILTIVRVMPEEQCPRVEYCLDILNKSYVSFSQTRWGKLANAFSSTTKQSYTWKDVNEMIALTPYNVAWKKDCNDVEDWGIDLNAQPSEAQWTATADTDSLNLIVGVIYILLNIIFIVTTILLMYGLYHRSSKPCFYFPKIICMFIGTILIMAGVGYLSWVINYCWSTVPNIVFLVLMVPELLMGILGIIGLIELYMFLRKENMYKKAFAKGLPLSP